MRPKVKDKDNCQAIEPELPIISTDQTASALGLPWEELGIKSRFMYRSVDAAMTAFLRPKQGVIDHLKSVIDPQTSNYDRIGALVNSFDAVLPGTAKRVSNFLYGSNKIPFEKDQIKLIAYGSASTVFLVETARGRRVVKIYKKSLGSNPEGLLRIAKFYRRKYELALSWYKRAPDLVLATSFVILHSPVLGCSAAAALQEYIEGENGDFINDFSDGELLSLMRQNDALREQFTYFANQTIHMYSNHNIMCVDLLGEGNLKLAKTGDLVTLKLVDFGVAPINARRARSVRQQISRLKTLLEEISDL